MKYRKAVFILTYRIKNSKPEYLILKRKLHWRGWEFPKGGLKKFESKKKAIKREVAEETGLKPVKNKIKKFKHSGKYDYKKIFPDRPDIKGQTFQLYAVEVPSNAKDKIKIDNKEHSDYKWVSFDVALKKLKWSNQRKSLKIVHKWLKEKLHK